MGAGIGAFISVLPLYGLHTLLVILAAIIVRPANKIAILIGTNISLPLTVPFITWAGYEIGRFILQENFQPLTWGFFQNLTLQKLVSHYRPLFLGSLVLGIICGAIVYCLTFFVVKGIKERRNLVAGTKNNRP